jgi:hypothetical protein
MSRNTHQSFARTLRAGSTVVRVTVRRATRRHPIGFI